MTNKEARVLLGADDNASSVEIRRRYQEQYSDLQIRLTNAPTPELRKVYQRNVQQLREAVETLLPGAPLEVNEYLPQAQPTLTPDFASARGASAPTQARRAEKSAPGPKAEDVGLSKGTRTAATLVILLAGVAVFAGLQWMRNAESLSAATAAIDQAKKANAELAGRAALLENGRFKACNKSSRGVTITWVGVTYMDNGQPKTFNSDLCDRPEWTVRAMSSLSEFQRQGCVWNGDVVVFALTVRPDGSDSYQVAGHWSTVKDGCATVAVD